MQHAAIKHPSNFCVHSKMNGAHLFMSCMFEIKIFCNDMHVLAIIGEISSHSNYHNKLYCRSTI